MILFCDFQTLWIGRPQFPTIKTTIGSLSNLKREELEAFNLVIKTPQEVLTRKSEDFRCLAALKNCVVKTLNFVQGVPTSFIENSKFSPFYWVKIQNSPLFIPKIVHFGE